VRSSASVLPQYPPELIEPVGKALLVEERDHDEPIVHPGESGRVVPIGFGGPGRPVQEQDEPVTHVVVRLVRVEVQDRAVEVDLHQALAHGEGLGGVVDGLLCCRTGGAHEEGQDGEPANPKRWGERGPGVHAKPLREQVVIPPSNRRNPSRSRRRNGASR
jgi:hypothetical protein